VVNIADNYDPSMSQGCDDRDRFLLHCYKAEDLRRAANAKRKTM
jgi:hypothetical protein